MCYTIIIAIKNGCQFNQINRRNEMNYKELQDQRKQKLEKIKEIQGLLDKEKGKNNFHGIKFLECALHGNQDALHKLDKEIGLAPEEQIKKLVELKEVINSQIEDLQKELDNNISETDFGDEDDEDDEDEESEVDYGAIMQTTTLINNKIDRIKGIDFQIAELQLEKTGGQTQPGM